MCQQDFAIRVETLPTPKPEFFKNKNNINVIFELAKNMNIEVKMYNILGSEIETVQLYDT